MQPYICAKFIDTYLIASRFSNIGVKINEKIYQEFAKLSKNDSETPLWAIDILAKLGFEASSKQKINDLFFIKEK